MYLGREIVSLNLHLWTTCGIIIVVLKDGGLEMSNDEVVKLLREVRELLIPISDAFRGEYEERLRILGLLEEVVSTAGRRRAYPLMNGVRTQTEIAKKARVSAAMVSRFVPLLLEAELIDIVRDGAVEKPRALYYLETGRPIRRKERGE